MVLRRQQTLRGHALFRDRLSARTRLRALVHAAQTHSHPRDQHGLRCGCVLVLLDSGSAEAKGFYSRASPPAVGAQVVTHRPHGWLHRDLLS